MTLVKKIGLLMLAATCFIAGTLNARADIVIRIEGNLSTPGADPLGLNGSHFVLDLHFQNGATYAPPNVSGGGTVTTISNSFTISGSAGADGAYSAQTQIIFAPADYGQFGSSPDYFNPSISFILPTGTLEMHDLLTPPNNPDFSEFADGQPLQFAHFGTTPTSNAFSAAGGGPQYGVSGLQVTNAPEPTTTALFGAGACIAAIGAVRRRLMQNRNRAA